MEPRIVSLPNAVAELKSADLVLFRGRGVIASLIQRAGRGQVSHAGKLSYIDGRWYVCEMREFAGGRIVTLASQVKQYPGQIDVYRSNGFNLPELTAEQAAENAIARGYFYDRREADQLMRSFAGQRYGYRAILKAWALHSPALWVAKIASLLPCLRKLQVVADWLTKVAPDITNDALDDGSPPYCSAACAIADRLGGGVDPVPNLADAYTEPADLARSHFYKYLMTLVP